MNHSCHHQSPYLGAHTTRVSSVVLEAFFSGCELCNNATLLHNDAFPPQQPPSCNRRCYYREKRVTHQVQHIIQCEKKPQASSNSLLHAAPPALSLSRWRRRRRSNEAGRANITMSSSTPLRAVVALQCARDRRSLKMAAADARWIHLT